MSAQGAHTRLQSTSLPPFRRLFPKFDAAHPILQIGEEDVAKVYAYEALGTRQPSASIASTADPEEGFAEDDSLGDAPTLLHGFTLNLDRLP